MEIRSLTGIDMDTICKTFHQAFANYEVRLNNVQLKTMLKRRGFVPDLSFAAFDKNEIVAFTLNGIGNFNEVPTAYDTGTGTLKEYRGKGLATQIFEYSIPYLKDRNIKQYLLEVLQHNTKAVSVYRNLEFKTTREFNYFMQKNDKINNEIKSKWPHHSVQQVGIESLGSTSDFWDFYPSWQNNFEAISRKTDDFVILGAFTKERLTGYCVFEPASGDIAQIAVDKQNRRKGIASSLLREVIRLNKNDTIKIINTDISCNSITDFLKTKNIHVKGKQFEMIRKI